MRRWLDTFAEVRDLCPRHLAEADFAAGESAVLKTVLETETVLAGRGVHVHIDGTVSRTASPDARRWQNGAQSLRRSQHCLWQAQELARNDLLEAASQEDQARLRSCGGWAAGAWLTTAPRDAVATWRTRTTSQPFAYVLDLT